MASTTTGILANSAIIGGFTTPAASQNNVYIAAAQRFVVSAQGLRPTTRHYFYYNNVDSSASCQIYGGLPGDNLQTDANGAITFTYYYNSNLPSTATSLLASQDLKNRVAGTKQAILTNSDNTSSCYVTLQVLSGSAVSNSFVSTPVSIVSG